MAEFIRRLLLVKLLGWSCRRRWVRPVAGAKVGYSHQDHGNHGEARRDPKAVFKLVAPPGDSAQAT